MNKNALNSTVQKIADLLEKKVLSSSRDKVYLDGKEIEHMQIERDGSGKALSISLSGGEFLWEINTNVNLFDADNICIDENHNIVLHKKDKTSRLTFQGPDYQLLDSLRSFIPQEGEDHYFVTIKVKMDGYEDSHQAVIKAPTEELAYVTFLASFTRDDEEGLDWDENGLSAQCPVTGAALEVFKSKTLSKHQYDTLIGVGSLSYSFEAMKSYIPEKLYPDKSSPKIVSPGM